MSRRGGEEAEAEAEAEADRRTEAQANVQFTSGASGQILRECGCGGADRRTQQSLPDGQTDRVFRLFCLVRQSGWVGGWTGVG